MRQVDLFSTSNLFVLSVTPFLFAEIDYGMDPQHDRALLDEMSVSKVFQYRKGKNRKRSSLGLHRCKRQSYGIPKI